MSDFEHTSIISGGPRDRELNRPRKRSWKQWWVLLAAVAALICLLVPCDRDEDGWRGRSEFSASIRDTEVFGSEGRLWSDRLSGSDCNDADRAVRPDAVEICDGKDNGCDGDADEGVLNACGRCGHTQPEICDGKDNDCDGQVDEAIVFDNVPNQKGVCEGDKYECREKANKIIDGPLGSAYENEEITCDHLDNDCDGATDEEGVCRPVVRRAQHVVRPSRESGPAPPPPGGRDAIAVSRSMIVPSPEASPSPPIPPLPPSQPEPPPAPVRGPEYTWDGFCPALRLCEGTAIGRLAKARCCGIEVGIWEGAGASHPACEACP